MYATFLKKPLFFLLCALFMAIVAMPAAAQNGFTLNCKNNPETIPCDNCCNPQNPIFNGDPITCCTQSNPGTTKEECINIITENCAKGCPASLVSYIDKLTKCDLHAFDDCPTGSACVEMPCSQNAKKDTRCMVCEMVLWCETFPNADSSYCPKDTYAYALRRQYCEEFHQELVKKSKQ
jgi:hypothetical protein